MSCVPDRVATWLDWVTSPRHAWACLALAVLFTCAPPDGLGVDLCLCHRLTGAPCPGCGLTRGSAALVRGDWRRAVNYNPFALIALPALVGFGVIGLLPTRARLGLRRRLQGVARLLRLVYLLGISAFLIFGLVRWLGVFVGMFRFPAS